ncbi:TetR/AcrR family transcriptional regulator [Pseudomonas sp. JG-B]|uniref:TetR/AcrR family transcriptional regulator n=1 Tax=Pseudomonas sp. JG-B TaxID=2603214 RepID=UPI0012CFDCC4|nr:TetR/AcrR family transcriptional regulator [Pseudomonas sp. JG-B]
MKTAVQNEPGKRNTIRRLIEAARQEFSEKGLSGVRMEEVASAAGVTKQLIYHYYGSKEGLFVAVLDECSERIMSELVGLEVDDLAPEKAMRTMLNHFFDQYCEDPLLGSLAHEGMHYHNSHQTPRNRFLELAPALIDKFDNILRRGAMSGDFKPDVNSRLLLATAALVTTGWFTNRYSMSTLAGLDTTSEEGMNTWRSYSADFILAGITLRHE